MQIFANTNKIKDSARELILEWQSRGYCSIQPSIDDHIWVNKIGQVCLFDLTIFRNMNERARNAELVILGNKDVGDVMSENMTHGFFWARHPKMLEESIANSLIDWDTRKFHSTGIFQVENAIQAQRRMISWGDVMDNYQCKLKPANLKSYVTDHNSYISQLLDSKYGLDQLGFGARCNRLVEICAVGAIPVIPDDYYKDMFNSFLENTHFLIANDPEEFKTKTQLTKDEGTFISQKANEFYWENFSIEGSFMLLSRILEEKGII